MAFLTFFLSLTSSTYSLYVEDKGLRLHLITLSDAYTLGRTPPEEGSARRRDPYPTTHNIHDRHPCPRRDSNPQSKQASGRRPTTYTWFFLSQLKYKQLTMFRTVSVDTKAQTASHWGPIATVHNNQCRTVQNSPWHSPSVTTASTNNLSTETLSHRDCAVYGQGSFRIVTRILRNPKIHHHVHLLHTKTDEFNPRIHVLFLYGAF